MQMNQSIISHRHPELKSHKSTTNFIDIAENKTSNQAGAKNLWSSGVKERPFESIDEMMTNSSLKETKTSQTCHVRNSPSASRATTASDKSRGNDQYTAKGAERILDDIDVNLTEN